MKPVVTSHICLLFLFFILYNESWSQSTLNIGVNVGVGNRGFFQNGKRGLGGSIEYVNLLWKQGGVRVYTGYDWFDQRRPKNLTPQQLNDSMQFNPYLFHDKSILALRIGYQQFLYKHYPFLYGEVGVAHWITAILVKRNVFTYALGSGYRFELKENRYAQLSIFYNQNIKKEFMNRNYFIFKAAYGLNFPKK